MQRLSRRTFLLGMTGLGLSSIGLPAASAFESFEPFSFVYVTDVHLALGIPDSYKLVHESQLFLQEAIKQINRLEPDFVVFGGDQVDVLGKDMSNWQLFLDCVQALNAPWSFVLGETDVSGEVAVDKMKTYGPDWKARGIDTSTPYWSHNPEALKGVHLIGLDTSLSNSKAGNLTKPQLSWLKNDLNANEGKFTIVFAHHPLLPPPPYDAGPPWDEYVLPNGSDAREIIGSHPNVRLVLSGHVHVSKVQQERDAWHISNPSLVVYPCAFRLFTVTPKAVTMETMQVDFPALVKKARKELADSAFSSRYDRTNPNAFIALAEGNAEDRDSIIPFAPGQQIQPIDAKKRRKEREKMWEEEDKQKEDKGKGKKEKPSKTNTSKPSPKNTPKQPAEDAAPGAEPATDGTLSAPDSAGTSPNGTNTSPDAPARAPDAPTSSPDAPTSAPDAPVSAPDAPVTSPDAPVTSPDAPVGSPDAPVAPATPLDPSGGSPINGSGSPPVPAPIRMPVPAPTPVPTPAPVPAPSPIIPETP